MATIEVTHENFSQVAKKPIVLIDFWAAWCGPCRAFAPVFEAAAERHPDIVFGKVDTEAQPELAGAFQVQAIPTLMVLRDGVLLAMQPGALPKAALDDLIAKVRDVDMDELRQQIEAERAANPDSAGDANV